MGSGVEVRDDPCDGGCGQTLEFCRCKKKPSKDKSCDCASCSLIGEVTEQDVFDAFHSLVDRTNVLRTEVGRKVREAIGLPPRCLKCHSCYVQFKCSVDCAAEELCPMLNCGPQSKCPGHMDGHNA